MTDWTHGQLAAAVEAYRLMQHQAAAGRPVNKARVYRELAEAHGRTPKAWEYRMQNISHVLDQLQQPWLSGLRPAANVGPEVTSQLMKLLDSASLLGSATATAGETRVQLQEERQKADESLAASPVGSDDERRRVLATIIRRQGQSQFRSALLEAYGGKCAITGCRVVDVLEAAHVYPYKGAATNAVTNGLLLRTDVHTLFDLYLISIDPGTRLVRAAPDLLGTEYQALDGAGLAEPLADHWAVSSELLVWHRSQCRW